MKKLIRGLIACTALGCILPASHAIAVTAWSAPVTILGYYMYDSGGAVYFRTSGTHLNPDSCSSPAHLVLDSSAANFKVIFTQLVTAYTTQSTVQLYYNGCLGAQPKISAIAIPTVW